MFGNFGYNILISDKIHSKTKYSGYIQQKINILHGIEKEFKDILESNKVVIRKNDNILTEIESINAPIIQFEKGTYFGTGAIEKLMLFIQYLIDKNINSTGLRSQAFNEENEIGGLASSEIDRVMTDIARSFVNPNSLRDPYDDQRGGNNLNQVNQDKKQQESIDLKIEAPNISNTISTPSKETYVHFNRGSTFDLNKKQNISQTNKDDNVMYESDNIREHTFYKNGK